MGTYQWRSVRGSVEALSGHALDAQALTDFLAENQVIARAQFTGGSDYNLELAVCGRRRRVAIVRPDGTVGAGMHLSELVSHLAKVGMGVRAKVLDAKAFGDPDFGAFDINSELDIADLEARAAQHRRPPMPTVPVWEDTKSSGASVEQKFGVSCSEKSAANGGFAEVSRQLPPMPASPWKQKYPYLYLTDLPLAGVPLTATLLKHDLVALDGGLLRAIISDDAFEMPKSSFTSNFWLRFSGLATGQPQLVLCDGQPVSRAWAWDAELPDTSFTAENEVAREFAAQNLGAGALAAAIAEFCPGASAGEIKQALLCGPGLGPALLLQALGLPGEVLEVLVGALPATKLPNAHLFDEQGILQNLRYSFSLSSSGYGALPGPWRLYRYMTVDNPWIVRTMAGFETGMALGMLALGRTLAKKGSAARRFTTASSLLLLGHAASELLLARTVRNAVHESTATGLAVRPQRVSVVDFPSSKAVN